MTRVSATLLFLVVCIPSIVCAGEDNAYVKLHRSLRDLVVDRMSARHVEGIFLQQGLITITLDDGILVEMQALNGQRIGAYFVGKGTASFQPYGATEVTNLRRFYDKDVFLEEFNSILIVCTDDRLTSQLDLFERVELPKDMASIAAKTWNEAVMSGDGSWIDSRLARPLLNGYTEPVFMAGIKRLDELNVYMTYDPSDVEPYHLYLIRIERGRDIYAGVNQCPDPERPTEIGMHGVEVVDLVRIHGHEVKVNLSSSLDFSATDKVTMEVLADSVRWLEMSLFPLLKVRSVSMVDTANTRKDLAYHNPEKSSELWVEFPDWVRKGDRFTMNLAYDGEMIRRFGNYTVLMSSITWYPTHSYKQAATFDLSFEYPAYMTLASIGHRVTHSEKEKRKSDRWVIDRPVRNASFHIGLFKRKQLPPVTGIPSSSILYITSEQLDPVSIDVKQALEFFTKLYGPLVIDSLVATELPGSHGEAFPGMLHLSSEAFTLSASYSTSASAHKYERFFQEQFIAHEVAHQWWGISVFYKSYRDRWLSEGFSEYSALMYSQLASAEPGKFFNLLEEYRTDILKFGKKAIGTDFPPPAIHLGHRAASGDPKGVAYNTFIYEKGAWVLHMLRNMMLDLNTMNEDAFKATMKTFFTRYQGKPASTEDFQRTIEEITGVSMQWFFDQWVYGNEIPTYEYAWKSVKKAEGGYKNTLRIRQLNVSESFKMMVPIKIEYDDGTMVRHRLMVAGKEMTVELPDSISEIDELTFNDLLSVLADVDEVSF
jgi:hypothetical protein